jgi:uncharacterized membrane protein
MMDPAKHERYLHLVFVSGLVFKAIFAAAEIAAGIGSFFVSQPLLMRFADSLTREELMEDPRDVIATYLLNVAQHFSTSTSHFVGLYLTSHGAVKLALIVALLAKKVWAYPIGIFVFGAFVAYQIYRYSSTRSLSLIALTIVDLVVIWLTWHEYRFMRSSEVKTTRAA